MGKQDKPVPPDEEPQEEHQPTLDERIEAGVYAAYGQQSLVTRTGEPDQEALILKVYAIVSQAIVNKPSERKKVAVTRSQFMEQIFPDVPGEDEWIDQDDPEVAAGVYKALDTDIWRLLNVNPDGPIQGMLNGKEEDDESETSMLLCRADRSRGREAHAYVTRNRKCLYEDYSATARAAIERAVNRHAALMEQAINRVPEHGKAFLREYNGTTRLAVSGGAGIVRGALESGSNIPVDDDDGDDADE